MGKDNKYSHPSYGMVAMNKVTGTRRNLFGSALKEHGTTVRLAIKQGHRVHSSSGADFYHGTGRPLIEVELSASQFAQLITSMNVGDGVPCTILGVQGEIIEQAPEVETETDRVRNSFAKKIKDISEKIEKHAVLLDSILEKKTVSAFDKREIKKIFKNFVTDIKDNMPHIFEMFEESADKVVLHSKQEVESFVNQMITITGIKIIGKQLLEKEDKNPVLEDNDEGGKTF